MRFPKPIKQADGEGSFTGARRANNEHVLGQVFKGKLKPDGALALYAGVNRDAVVCCEVDESTALAFLRKQDIAAAQFEEGVNLVLYGSRPLGFVKRVGARVNNMYPNSLRILK